MDTAEVVDVVLFVSKFSSASKTVKDICSARDAKVEIVHLDTPETRQRALNDKQVNIKVVPTLLVVYSNGTADRIEGVDNCNEWVDRYFPDLSGDPEMINDPKNPTENRSDAMANTSPVDPYHFPDNEHMNQRLFGDSDETWTRPSKMDDRGSDQYQSPVSGVEMGGSVANSKPVDVKSILNQANGVEML